MIIAPDDAQLITGNSEERRKFLDALLSQLDHDYLLRLIAYNKILQQRNSLLKASAETGQLNESLLEVLDAQLIDAGDYVFNRRKEFMVGFLPVVRHLYHEIAKQPEDISLIYESQLMETSFETLLRQCRKKDCQLQRSTAGIHRDDLEINMGTQPFRNIASQGQRKSLLFALKLAEMEVLKKDKGFPPLLLLDDVFEKLDEGRISNLLQKVCLENEGQVFITDTNEQRLRSHFEQIGTEFGIIAL